MSEGRESPFIRMPLLTAFTLALGNHENPLLYWILHDITTLCIVSIYWMKLLIRNVEYYRRELLLSLKHQLGAV